MKYIYFDCYGGMDLEMMLASLIDMDKEKTNADRIAGMLFPDAEFIMSNVNRCGMYAAAVCCDLRGSCPDDLNEAIQGSTLSDETKSRLKLWYRLKSDGKARDVITEAKELLCAAVCLELIKLHAAKKVYISEISQGQSASIIDGEIKPIPSPHTELLCKMADIKIKSLPDCKKEILTPGAATLLYILNADYLPPKAHNVIKSGYGAGEYDSTNFANILRCILANDGEDELNIDFEELIMNMKSECSLSVK